MTIQQLIDDLNDLIEEGVDPGTPVRLAIQPRWAFEYDISTVAATEPNEDDEGQVVYIGEGRQLGYLPGAAHHALGWRD